MDESKNNGLEADWIENTKQQEHATQRVAWNCWPGHQRVLCAGTM